LESRFSRTWWDAWIDHCPANSLIPDRLLVLPNEVALLSNSGAICRYHLQDRSTLDRPLDVSFGKGVNPNRSIDEWISAAKRFGESSLVDLSIACCEQALATCEAMKCESTELIIPLPDGKSFQETIDDVKIEYRRWVDRKESLKIPIGPHDRWNDVVTCQGVPELSSRVGSQWDSALQQLVQEINNEHDDSHDYRRPIGRLASFSWIVNGETGTLKYCRIFGSELMAAKVPRKSIALLGYEFSEAAIPSHIELEEIFTLSFGAERFWGNLRSRVLVSCSEPNCAYCL
jgi:hypothetical protein